MRTNEERSRLIHKRTAEIKREKQNRIQRGLDAVCIAVCLLLVTGIGAWMPAFLLGVCVTVLLYRLRRRNERRSREEKEDEL